MRINAQLLFKSVLPLMLGQIGQALVQGVQFLIVARMLGPHEFGHVASVLAITSALLPFSGLGSANTMVMHLARGAKEAHMLYGNALCAGLAVGTVLTMLTAGIGLLVTQDPNFAALCLVFGISELVATKLVDISQHVFFGLEKHKLASRLLLLQGIFRLIGAATMLTMKVSPVAMNWAWLHLFSGLLATVLVLIYTRTHTGHLTVNLQRLLSDVKTGVFFSLGLSARSIYTDVDKAVLGHVVSPAINGAYTAAFRVVFMATTPLSAGLLAIQARMFREGHQEGIHKTVRTAKAAIAIGVAYGVIVGTVLYLCAPFIPVLLGAKYAQSVVILQALAFLPIPLFVQSALSDALSAANFQRVRSMIQMAVAALSFGLNSILIRKFSWTGAVVATYSCQIALALLMAYMVASKLTSTPKRISSDTP